MLHRCLVKGRCWRKEQNRTASQVTYRCFLSTWTSSLSLSHPPGHSQVTIPLAFVSAKKFRGSLQAFCGKRGGTKVGVFVSSLAHLFEARETSRGFRSFKKKFVLTNSPNERSSIEGVKGKIVLFDRSKVSTSVHSLFSKSRIFEADRKEWYEEHRDE